MEWQAFAEEEYAQWRAEAGFVGFARFPLAAGNSLIIGPQARVGLTPEKCPWTTRVNPSSNRPRAGTGVVTCPIFLACRRDGSGERAVNLAGASDETVSARLALLERRSARPGSGSWSFGR